MKVRKTLGKREVTFEKEGYHSKTIKLEKRFNFFSLFNFIGLYGFGVDIITGAILLYPEVYYDVELEPVNKATE